MKAISLRAAERPVSCVKFNRDGDLIFTAGQVSEQEVNSWWHACRLLYLTSNFLL